jgi:5-methylthioribose kinase
MRRIIGMAHVEDLDSIGYLKQRATAEILGLKIAENILLNREKVNEIYEFIDLIKQSSN